MRLRAVALATILALAFSVSIIGRRQTGLQAILDASKPGDVIVLAAGTRYVGNYVLPPRNFGVPVTVIKSSATLPERRVGPDDVALFPTIAPPTNDPALTIVRTAGWRVEGVRFESTPDGSNNLIAIQDSDDVTLDRILFEAPATGQRRAVMGNGTHITLTRSYITGVWAQSLQDSQAFCAWDGAGPYTITDNYLEAASENILFGGASSKSVARIPSDILVEGNILTKRWDWKGKPRAVKNLFELKAARRVVIRGNLLEHNWTDAQAGYAVLFTARNDEGTAPWSVVEDVLFEQNRVRDSEHGVNILGYDSYHESGRTTRVTLRDNLIDVPGAQVQIGGEAGDVTIDHLTAPHGWKLLSLYRGQVWPAGSVIRDALWAVEKLVFTDSIAQQGEFGVFGENCKSGAACLTAMAKAYTFTANVVGGAIAADYPDGTLAPTPSDLLAQLVEPDYTVRQDGPYAKGAPDGTDLGWRPTTEVPPPPPQPSPTPTPVPQPPAPAVVDAEGAAWTFGPNKETLRNGIAIPYGYGTEYRLLAGRLYVLGTDANWYVWSGGAAGTWGLVGPTLPPDQPPPPTDPCVADPAALSSPKSFRWPGATNHHKFLRAVLYDERGCPAEVRR